MPSDEHDFEKRMGPLFQAFRAKCTELNMVNAEFVEKNRRVKELYEEYTQAHAELSMGLGHQLTEIRSELQAMQAEMLDAMCEHLIGPRHPHERGEKHD